MFIEKAQNSPFGKASNLSRGERVNRRPGSESGNGKGYFERRRKETSLSRIFDQPLGRANSLARNNWISSKGEAGKTFSGKVAKKQVGKDARRRFILWRIMLEQPPTIIRN